MIYELYLNKAVKTKTALHCYIPVEITPRKQGYCLEKNSDLAAPILYPYIPTPTTDSN